MSLTVMVTGANGFVGRALLERLGRESDYLALAGVRDASGDAAATVRRLGNLAHLPADPALLAGVDVVVHCAARVHVMRETSGDPLADFRAVNVHGSLQLARAAAAAGVRRFIYLSTIKVHGEGTSPGQPFTADSPLFPHDPYARSKQEAEQALRVLAQESGMELVIIRPPLVYGPGVKGNFLSLLRWVQRGIPLPLGSIDNRRSLVALDNLIDLIMTCLVHPAAVNRAFLVSDGVDLSTTELLRQLAAALGRPVRLLPVPPRWLAWAARMLGRPALSERLCGSLQVDCRATCEQLGWTPPLSVEAAMAATARAFRETLR